MGSDDGQPVDTRGLLKHCRTCARDLPVDSFCKRTQSPDGLSPKCRLCKNQYNREWSARNKDHVKARERARYERNREKVIQRSRDWRAANRTEHRQYAKQWREQHPEHVVAYQKAWRAANKDVLQAMQVTRRSKKRGSEGRLKPKEWQAIVKAYNGCCAYCTKPFARLTQDHVIPLSRGGQHTAANVVPACRSCNSRKGTRLDVKPALQPAQVY